ncbi:ATP-binding cassette domain-containing protein [Ruania zhangjianzhongii]|uniref:ATP-binding cassette domain-containing protein n=1 Tax=Ruania zhangjianzhongii TaxID=2603206 RepID=UPI0011C9B442|nr:ABC transporter ATP-binding protein [Ruania zhangjianzhongii]
MTAPSAAPLDVQLRNVRADYGSTTALDGVDVNIPAGTITGLLGRNGSGKTTMLSLIASLRRPTAGQVLVGGEDPFENETLMEQISLTRESGDVLSDESLAVNLRYAADSRPSWHGDLAGRALEMFQLHPKRVVQKLSRGQRSAFGAVLGLATRAPVTMLDEVYLGMDAPSRYAFYDLLLEDYLACPRTIILSSHLIVEIERLLEHVVILDRGGVLVAEESESLRSQGLQVTGRSSDLDALLARLDGITILATRSLGPTSQITLTGTTERLRAAETAVRAAGMDVSGVNLQDLFVHLTGSS